MNSGCCSNLGSSPNPKPSDGFDANRVSRTESPAALRIRVSDKAHVGDLKWYLEATECSVRVVGQVTLDVSIPRASSDAQALGEVATYLNAWQAMNPTSTSASWATGVPSRTELGAGGTEEEAGGR